MSEEDSKFVDRAEVERLTKKAEHLQNRVTNLWLEGYAMIGRMEQVREVLAGTDANSLPRDYSLVQVAKDRMNDLKEARAEAARLAAENEKLRAALEWYASSEAWTMNQLEGDGDYGRRARTALQDKSDESGEGKAAIEKP